MLKAAALYTTVENCRLLHEAAVMDLSICHLYAVIPVFN